MQDYVTLLRELVTLIKDRETEAAAVRVAAARNHYEAVSYEKRCDIVASINRNIIEIKYHRELLRQTVFELPQEEKMFAQVRIEEIVDGMFVSELAHLRKNKRHHSKPR